MDIRNVTQFAGFVGGNGLADIEPVFRQLVICMGDYSRACECHHREDKARIYSNCNRLYHAAMTTAMNHKMKFLSKVPDRIINFYSEGGQLIGRLNH